MKNIQYIILIAAIIISTSCEKEIEFNGEITESQIVLNSYVTTDSVVSVHLSKSRFFLSSKIDFVLVRNAKIELYVNNTLKEELVHVSEGWYKGTYIPKENDEIELRAKVPTYNEIKTKTKIPQKVEIVNIDTTFIAESSYPFYADGKVIGEQLNGKLLIDITLKDNSDQLNFYRISMKTFQVNDTTNERMNEWNAYFSLRGYDISGNNIFDLLEGDLDNTSNSNFHLMNDELFNGNELKLTIEQQVSYFKAKSGIIIPKEQDYFRSGIPSYEINVQSVSRDMYLFLKSKEASQDAVIKFISEPVVIYNNIENGIGILGSFTDNKREIRLK